MTDARENQEPLKINNSNTNPIAQFCEGHKLLNSHKKRDALIALAIIFISSYLVSLFSFCLISKSTCGWWMLFFGLLISFTASDMISIGSGKLGSLIGGVDVYASDEIRYGNEILRIGFACQLFGLILSVIDS